MPRIEPMPARNIARTAIPVIASAPPSTENALAVKIARRIRSEGPLTLAAYMAIALHDPDLGYYATRRPIGAAGDFVTAPEISQVFGELIGLWCALVWEQIGRPDPVILAELGPGSGILASDLLRAASALPEFRCSLRLYLVETSPVLRAEQQRRLAFADPVWLARVEELPAGPVLIVANEFLESEVCELMQAVSQAYVRGRFKSYNG